MKAQHPGFAERARSWMGLAQEPERFPGEDVLFVAGGIGLGAGIVYVLDPNRGRRRRGLVRDRITHLVGVADYALGATVRDVTNRTRGVIVESRAMLYREDVPDDVLERRVRSKLGHYVSHPASIGVVVHEGRVFLSGPILASEVEPFLGAIRRVHGVQGIENRLDEHERREDISGLQGGVERTGEQYEMLQSHWSPTARVLAFLAGGTLAWWGAGRRGPLGMTLGLLGAGLFAHGATGLIETGRPPRDAAERASS